MKKVLIFFKDHFLFFLTSLVLLVLFVPFYQKGQIIAGGEGSYFLDFLTLVKNYGYSWFNRGPGQWGVSLSFGYVFHLILLQVLTKSERVVNFVMIFSNKYPCWIYIRRKISKRDDANLF